MLPATNVSRLEQLARRIQRANSLVRVRGRVSAVAGSRIITRGITSFVTVGDLVGVESGNRRILAEVLSLSSDTADIQLLESSANVAIDSSVEVVGPFTISPADDWRGRVINALGEPIDGKGKLTEGPVSRSLSGSPPNSMERGLVGAGVKTGVKAVDVFLPLCLGQRVGIFAGSGVGKSTLLSMLSRSPGFDTVVVALVGERGREVMEFVTETLGDALQRSVVVVSTSDEAATRRKMVPLVATSIAEFFRDEGQNVLLMMDSVTRYAHALRELALSAGEPPVARGYPPSVFGKLPQLLERAGPGQAGVGSITALYTVLVDGDNHNEPVADTMRGILDGHIVLDRTIAAAGRFPAIDILSSISRLANKAWRPEERKSAQDMRRLVSLFEESKDLRTLGGYHPGVDPELDKAVAFVPRLYAAMQQTNLEPPCADAFAAIAKATRGPNQ